MLIDRPPLAFVLSCGWAVFFFLVGLELKREVLIGELSNVKQIILPAGAALGGGGS